MQRDNEIGLYRLEACRQNKVQGKLKQWDFQAHFIDGERRN